MIIQSQFKFFKTSHFYEALFAVVGDLTLWRNVVPRHARIHEGRVLNLVRNFLVFIERKSSA